MPDSKEAAPWSKLPPNWTEDSVKKFWATLTSAAPKHKVTECIDKMKDSGMDDPGAFCASLADKMIPGWRQEAAKERAKKKAEENPMSLREATIRLAHENPDLRHDLLATLKTAEPRYRDYVRRYKGEGSPMSKEEWEKRVLPRWHDKQKTKGEGKGKPAEKAKGEGKKPEAPATPAKKYKHKQTPELKAHLDKHKLHDDDAEEILKFKKGKPVTGKPLTDAQLLQRFLQKASPETKKRMMGPPPISPADFKVIYSAIMEDEEGGGKQASGKEAIRPLPPRKDKCSGKPKSYAEYRSCTDAKDPLTEEAWKARQQGSAAWGIRSADEALIANLTKLAAEDESLRPHLEPLLREAAGHLTYEDYVRDWKKLPYPVDVKGKMLDKDRWEKLMGRSSDKKATTKMAHGPVSMRDPDAMYFYIDPANNNSKFYEMRIVPAGRETRAQKSAGNPATAQWVLERRWGRLTDTGASGRVDSYNEYWSDKRMAERSMMEHGRKRTGKGYEDVSRSQEYPIGLGAAGFGWGGQAACRIIPELGELKEAMQKALASVAVAKRQLRPIAAQDSSMAQKLSGMLEGVEGSVQSVVTYLDGQLAYCR